VFILKNKSKLTNTTKNGKINLMKQKAANNTQFPTQKMKDFNCD